MRSSLRWVVALQLVVWTFLCPTFLLAASPEKLAVRNFVAQGMEQFKVNLFTTLVISELEATGKFSVYSKTDIQEVPNQIGQTQQLDKECISTTCILDFGAAMGVDRVLAGEVGKIGSRYVVTLSLYNIIKGEREVRNTWECSCSEDDLTDRVKGYALEILGLEASTKRKIREEIDRQEQGKILRKALEVQTADEAKIKSEQEQVARAATEPAVAERQPVAITEAQQETESKEPLKPAAQISERLKQRLAEAAAPETAAERTAMSKTSEELLVPGQESTANPTPMLPAEAHPNLNERLARRLASGAPTESRPVLIASQPLTEAVGPVGYFPHAWYLAVLKEKVFARWSPPSEYSQSSSPPVASVYFRIDRAGGISGLTLKESSGSAIFDQSALAAVQGLGKGPALPEQYVGKNLEVVIRFQEADRRKLDAKVAEDAQLKYERKSSIRVAPPKAEPDRRVQMIVKSYPPSEIEENHDAIPYPELIIRTSSFKQGWCQVYLVLAINGDGEVEGITVERPQAGDRSRFEPLIETVEKSVRGWDYAKQRAEVHVDVRFYVE